MSGEEAKSNRTGDRSRGLLASASDVLPTAEVLARVKRGAAEACARRAARAAWPSLNQARSWIDIIPLVALAALTELCPGVAPGRLARCLGLDPLDGPDQVELLKADDGPTLRVVRALARKIGGTSGSRLDPASRVKRATPKGGGA